MPFITEEIWSHLPIENKPRRKVGALTEASEMLIIEKW